MTGWQKFRANRRAWVALWLFGLTMLACLPAEWIANDRPLLLRFGGRFYAPVVQDIPETLFGGALRTPADYRDPAVRALIRQGGGWMVWPLVPFSFDTMDEALNRVAPSPPDARHWLGTDDQARDVLARLVHGFRLTTVFALLLTGLSAAIGIFVGAAQGYFGGWLDLVGQRVVEIWVGLPLFFMLILLSGLMRPGFWGLLGLLLLFSWTHLVDVVRAEFLRGRQLDYVRAARALGVGDLAIIGRHILPNALVSAVALLPFRLSAAVTALTALDFLGLGLPPGSASLGEMLAQGKANLQAPWIGLGAIGALAAILMMAVFIGEGLRDALDPRKSAA